MKKLLLAVVAVFGVAAFDFGAQALADGAAEKAARFVQICDAFDIPLLVLCDTPGLMA